MTAGSPGDDRRPAEKWFRRAGSLWEWVAAALGALLVSAALAHIIWAGLTGQEEPPVITVERVGTTRVSENYLVRFRAINLGGSTASQLLIRGELSDGQAVVESSESQLDYLPRGSAREGGLFFRRNPEHFELTLSPSGYVKP